MTSPFITRAMELLEQRRTAETDEDKRDAEEALALLLRSQNRTVEVVDVRQRQTKD